MPYKKFTFGAVLLCILGELLSHLGFVRGRGRVENQNKVRECKGSKKKKKHSSRGLEGLFAALGRRNKAKGNLQC